MSVLLILLLAVWAFFALVGLGAALSGPARDYLEPWEFSAYVLLILLWPLVLVTAVVRIAWYLAPSWIADPLADLGDLIAARAAPAGRAARRTLGALTALFKREAAR